LPFQIRLVRVRLWLFHDKNSMSTPEQSPAKEDMSRVAGVIVTHGHLAGELLAAAEMIVGPISFVTAVSIGWHDDVDAARDEVQRAITRVSQGAGVLLLTDMFGGTPTNIASMFLDEGNIEVVTGVNLPMVIKLASQPTGISLIETARRVCDLGRQGIYLAGDLLAPPNKSN
jgi:PTS system mannose-specific IIA component